MKSLEIQVEKASEAYLSNTSLRALITAIPYIGGPLDIIFCSKGNKIIQDRITYLLDTLKSDLYLLKEELIDKDFLESEQFFDLTVKAIDASSKTAHKNKIVYYSKMLKGSILNQNREQYYPEDYLNILIELTPREIEVARIIYIKEKEMIDETGAQIVIDLKKLSINCPFVPKEDIYSILIRLMRVGLLRPTTGWGAGVEYVITEVFRKIMQYLEIQKQA